MNPLIRMTAALTFAGLSMGAFAQAKNFEGMNATGSVGYQTATGKISDMSVANVTVSDTSLAGATVNLGLEYIISMNDQYTLGLGVEANVLPSNSGRHESYLNGTKIANNGGELKVASSYGLFVSPGMAVSSETLIYAKLGYVQLTTSGTYDNGTNRPNNSSNGYSLGLGLKQLLGKNTFLFGEFNYITLQTKDGASGGATYKTSGSATNGVVGIGYKF
jgi:opacity protein-like surface antigen